LSTKTQKTAQKVNSDTLTVPSLVNSSQPKYCSQCGEKCEDCQCGCCNQQTTTICVSFNTSALQNLVNLLPKFQISTSTSRCCSECGHMAHSGECADPNCGCK